MTKSRNLFHITSLNASVGDFFKKQKSPKCSSHFNEISKTNCPGDYIYLKKTIETLPAPPIGWLGEKLRFTQSLAWKRACVPPRTNTSFCTQRKWPSGESVSSRPRTRSEMEPKTEPPLPPPMVPAAHHTDVEEKLLKNGLGSSLV